MVSFQRLCNTLTSLLACFAISRDQKPRAAQKWLSMLLQVRMQTEGKLPAGVPRRYPNAFSAYAIIARYGQQQHMRKHLGMSVTCNM